MMFPHIASNFHQNGLACKCSYMIRLSRYLVGLGPRLKPKIFGIHVYAKKIILTIDIQKFRISEVTKLIRI